VRWGSFNTHEKMSISPTLRRVFIFALFAANCSGALAQQTLPFSDNPLRPEVGATGGLEIPQRLPTFGPSGGNDILRHRDPMGRPCLAVGGFARPQIINPNLYEHVIVAVNSCAKRIDMQVCYYQSQDCIPVNVQGGERKEAILGLVPAEKNFRFEFREKF
jgi:hypothetical protein